MCGRPTPSRELDEVAAYVASEFRRLNLRPAGDSGTFLQHYPLDGVPFRAGELVSERRRERATATWRIGNDVLLVQGEAPAGIANRSRVAIVTGNPQSGW